MGADGPPRIAVRAEVGFWEILAFTCEVVLLAVLALSGWQLGSRAAGTAGAVAGLVVLPALFVAAWARWLAPTSGHRLRGAALAAGKAAVFVLSCAAFAAAGQPLWAVVLLVVSLGDLAVVSRRPTSASG